MARAALVLMLLSFFILVANVLQMGFSQPFGGCGAANGDLYTLPACAEGANGSLVNRAWLTFVSGGQSISPQQGQSLSFTVNYQIWQGSNPSEIDQLMFIASWTPNWPPPAGYYWGIYSAVPPGSPGTSGSVTFSLSAPAFQSVYYLWFVFDPNYGYPQAANSFTTPLGTPAHIRLNVVPELSELAPLGAIAVVALSVLLVYQRRKIPSTRT